MDERRSVPVRIPGHVHREFMKALIDDQRYSSAQDFFLKMIEKYLEEVRKSR